MSSATLQRGSTVLLTGNKFNGASQACAYGDDAQCATNYPIVRFTSTTDGHVFYAKTHDHNTMAVGYTGLPTPMSTFRQTWNPAASTCKLW